MSHSAIILAVECGVHMVLLKVWTPRVLCDEVFKKRVLVHHIEDVAKRNPLLYRTGSAKLSEDRVRIRFVGR